MTCFLNSTYSNFTTLRIQLRVDVPGEDTEIVFDKVLANLARTAPPVPGFRRQKGGDKLLFI